MVGGRETAVLSQGHKVTKSEGHKVTRSQGQKVTRSEEGHKVTKLCFVSPNIAFLVTFRNIPGYDFIWPNVRFPVTFRLTK